MKKLLVLFLAVLSLFAFSCGGKERETETEEIISSSVSSVTADTEEKEVFFRKENLLTGIPNFYGKHDSCLIRGMKDGIAIGIATDYEPAGSTVFTIDLSTLKAIAQKKFKTAVRFRQNGFSDGSVLLESDGESGVTLFAVNEKLETLKTFSGIPGGAYFSDGFSSYYTVYDGAFCEYGTDNELLRKIPLPSLLEAFFLEGTDAKNGIAYLTVSASAFEYKAARAEYDIKNGKFIFLNEDFYDYQRTTDAFVGYTFDYSLEKTDLSAVCGISENGNYICRALTETSGENDYYSFIPVKNSPYFIMTHAVYTGSGHLGVEYDDCVLYRVGKDGVKKSLLTDGDRIGLNFSNAEYLPFEELIICTETYISGGNYISALCVIDPHAASFSDEEYLSESITVPPVDTSITENYARIPELPERYSEAVRAAEALERDFGIKVLISDQTELLSSAAYGYTAKSTSGIRNEENLIISLIGTVRSAASLYPDGFFRQFRNSTGGGGVVLLATGAIQGDITAAGLSYMTNGWYVIMLDVTQALADSSFCHEVWHCTENFILNYPAHGCSEIFDEFLKLNPEGFEYSSDHTDGASDGYTLFDNHGTVYFVDDYAGSYATEDRARIMEYVMKKETLADELMRHEPMRKKLSLMAEAIRRSFDTAGWENVYWERYF